jgi:hypothetical protein
MASDHRLLSTVRHLGQERREDAYRAPEDGGAEATGEPWPVDAAFSLAGATAWLNTRPLTGADLRGRVVAINFCTFTCINWLRQLPHVRAWERAYRPHGLVVIGVHSPEFSFEHDVESVRRELDARQIGYPVAVDNRFRIWRSFDNHFWPALYLVDATGRLRHSTAGEGGYEETDGVLRQLLGEAGAADLVPPPAPTEVHGSESPADWDTLRSTETYLGSDRTSGLASSPLPVPGRSQVHAEPPRLRVGQWALTGRWTVDREFAVCEQAGGRLTYRFQARDLHLVAGPGGAAGGVRFRVRLDGREPGADHGVDVDPSGAGRISEARMHQLIRQRGPVDGRTFEIEFLDPGAESYAFTFG